MRLSLSFALVLCLAGAAGAQDAPRGAVPPEASRRPVTALFENLRDRLLARSAPRGEPAEHQVVLRLSEELFTSLIDREVDHQGPVQEIILGTFVTGQARTVASPRIDVIPSDSQASFDVVMEGTTTTQTVGRNGPAVIHSRGITRFRAAKQVRFSPEKGFYAEPATVAANTQIVTDGVSSDRGRLVNRVIQRRAWREIEARRPQTLAIVQEKAKRRVAEVLDHKVDEGLAELNRRHDLRQLAMASLISDDRQPQLACCSTEHCIQLAAARGSTDKREIRLPTADYLTSPVQLWVHRSVVRSQIPDVLSRLAGDAEAFSSLIALRQFAPAAAFGAQVVQAAAAGGQHSPVQIATVDEWLVFEIGKEAQPSQERVVRR